MDSLMPAAQRVAVNAAVALQRPLLVKGEPGTGKTVLAQEIAKALGAPADRVAHQVHHQGAAGALRIRRGLAPARQPARRRARARHRNYIVRGKLWEAFESRAAPVLLIDEIDKADIEFPERPAARTRPHGVLRLRDAARRSRPAPARSSSSPRTTRRSCRTPSCAAASSTTSASPTARRWKIVDVHYPDIKKELLREALNVFFEIREVPGLKKKPSTSELLDWLKLLMIEDMPPRRCGASDPSAS
jgi:MoxR-like ATPase